MREIRTSGSMSGDGKRSVAAWPKLPRPSSTLPKCECRFVMPYDCSRMRTERLSGHRNSTKNYNLLQERDVSANITDNI